MAAPKRELSSAELRDLLTELGARLQAKGVQATIYIVGGAVIALELDVRRVTADVRAIFRPETTVRTEAEEMAAARGLPKDWLNSSVRGFVPGGDDGAVLLDVPGVVVPVASPEHLLAMKMASYRPGKDQSDLELLFDRLGITTASEAADIALSVYGPYTVVLPDRDELLLSAQAVVDRRHAKKAGRTKPGTRGREPRDSPTGGRFDVGPHGEPDVRR
jgi:hypothetical protein